MAIRFPPLILLLLVLCCGSSRPGLPAAAAQHLAAEDATPESVLFAESFSDPLDATWSWLREQPSRWRVRDGGLEIRLMPGLADTVENALLRPLAPAQEGQTVAIEVTVTQPSPPTQQYEQAGLTWYRDGQPIFKFVKELVDGTVMMIPGQKPVRGDTVQLRLEVTGTRYVAKYRTPDAEEFLTADSGTLPRGGTEQISLQGYHGPAQDAHWVRFTKFRMLRLQ